MKILTTKISCVFAEWTTKFQFLATLLVTLNLLSSGMHYGWPSPSLPKLLASDSQIQITNSDGSWLAVMVLFGAICGSTIAGISLNVIGRKRTILLSSLPLFISWIMIAFAHSYPVLLVARFFAGISDGVIFCSTPAYVGEIADRNIRGFLGTVLTTGSLIGVLTINIIGAYFSIKQTALMCSVVPILTLVTFVWMPESPYLLLMKDKIDKAESSLKFYKGVDDVEEELNLIKKAITKQNANAGKYWDLFKVKTNLKALLIVIGIRAIQQCSGISAITFYAQTIFTEGSYILSPVASSAIYFSCQVFIAIVSSMIIDKVGRKPLLIISTVGSGIALLVETCYFYIHHKTDLSTNDLSLVPVMALVVFVLFFGLGLQTIPIIMEGEMFEANIKAFAVCVSDISFSITAALVSKMFQYVKDEFGMYVPFFIFSIGCGIGVVFLVFCVPETKGKTLETIQDELQGMQMEKRPVRRSSLV